MPAHKKNAEDFTDVCSGCGASARQWFGYFCPNCGRFNRAMYVAEHHDPAAAADMTEDQIRAEYAAAGRSFEYEPMAYDGRGATAWSK
jgi:predicted ATP-dependent serine protease